MPSDRALDRRLLAVRGAGRRRRRKLRVSPGPPAGTRAADVAVVGAPAIRWLIRRGARVSEDGEVIRLVFLLRRKAGLSLSELRDRWRLDHGPTRGRQPDRPGGVALHPVAPHRRPDERGDGAAAAGWRSRINGVAELSWWSSEEGGARPAAPRRGAAPGRPCSPTRPSSSISPRRRCGSPTSTRRSTRRRRTSSPARRTASSSCRSSCAIPRAMSSDGQAQRYWRVQHGPLIRSMAAASGVLRYQQVHRFESPVEASLRASRGTQVESYTGHAEAWFRPRRPAAAGGRRYRGRRAIEDEPRVHRLHPLGHVGRQGARLRRPDLNGPPHTYTGPRRRNTIRWSVL